MFFIAVKTNFNTMKKITLVLIGLFLFSSCSKTETFKGDLYFKLIEFGNFYKLPEDKLVALENQIDSVNNKTKKISKEDEIIFNTLIKIKKNNLLRNPRILLKYNDTIKSIYLNKKQFEKLDKYTLDYLRKNHKKVEIELNIKEIDSGIYTSDKILSIKEVDGETSWKK